MEETEYSRPLRDIERRTLDTLLSADFSGSAELRDQIPRARVTSSHTSGAAPSFDILVPPSAPRSPLPAKMAPITAHVYDSDEEYAGEFLLWLSDGHLTGLEYAWITDEPPEDLPDPRSIQVTVKE